MWTSLLAQNVEHFLDFRRRRDRAKTDLISLLSGDEDLHAGGEHLQDVEGTHGRVDLLLLDAYHLGDTVRRIDSFLANLEVI